MREDFLHFIWKFKIFNTQELFTSKGEPVQILKAGIHNFNAGPDFSHAQIKIGDKIWAGHVELHIKASDWDLHKHSKDEAYNNVILHVVYIDDQKNASAIPVLELQNIIPAESIEKYQYFLQNQLWIPCANSILQADEFTKTLWLERMLIDRLQTKSEYIQNLYKESRNDWEQTAYLWLARNFGFKINADAFEELARRIPLKILAKHRNSLLQVEAMLFGAAGFLSDSIPDDAYFNQLKKEYQFLSGKYDLKAMEKQNWKFMRTHPGNFPPIRIAQIASLLFKSPHLLSNLLEIDTDQKGFSFFQTEASEYWKTHFQFGKAATKKQQSRLGKESIINLLINTVTPLQFCYGEIRNKPDLQDKAQNLLENLPPENNHITRGWKILGFDNTNAYRSQALIQLKNNYCAMKKCLSCGIGTRLLRNQTIKNQ